MENKNIIMNLLEEDIGYYITMDIIFGIIFLLIWLT